MRGFKDSIMQHLLNKYYDFMMIILDTFVYEGIAPRNYKNINNMILHLEAQGDNYLDL